MHGNTMFILIYTTVMCGYHIYISLFLHYYHQSLKMALTWYDKKNIETPWC